MLILKILFDLQIMVIPIRNMDSVLVTVSLQHIPASLLTLGFLKENNNQYE